MRIPMTDLKIQHAAMKDDINRAVERVMNSGQFILGPEVEAFEEEMASYCGTRYAVGVASGSDALTLSLLACGVKPGDEVITTPFTFVATATAITHCGAIPVFADINPLTYNIDPEQIEPQITNRTRAILPVHLFGQPAEMQPIIELANKFDLKIIEDCAQALSALYKGQKVGSLGDAGCFSFFPSKNLGACGDGGIITTNDPQIAETAKILRQHGAKTSYYYILTGFNSRLDAIQAAILRVKLTHLDYWSELRRQKAALYTRLLGEIDGIETPHIAEYSITSANYYTIRLSNHAIDRNKFRKHLASRGIETNIYYPLSLHLQEIYRHLGYRRGDFPQSEEAQERVLSLPIYPEITSQDLTEVASEIREFYRATVRSTV